MQQFATVYNWFNGTQIKQVLIKYIPSIGLLYTIPSFLQSFLFSHAC